MGKHIYFWRSKGFFHPLFLLTFLLTMVAVMLLHHNFAYSQNTGPWNLAHLDVQPAYTWKNDTGPIRSLLYTGEIYNDRVTDVFAYYATPGTLKGDAHDDRKLPAVV
jgi:hypothetical protein